jgi:hypothetical protein
VRRPCRLQVLVPTFIMVTDAAADSPHCSAKGMLMSVTLAASPCSWHSTRTSWLTAAPNHVFPRRICQSVT